MERIVFAIGIATGIALLAAYVESALWPAYRIWPPGGRNWKFWLHCIVDALFFLCLFILAYLDWRTFVFPDTPSLIAGGGLLVIGGVIALAVELELGHDETLGMEGELKMAGPYRYSRNPTISGFDSLLLVTLGTVSTDLLLGPARSGAFRTADTPR